MSEKSSSLGLEKKVKSMDPKLKKLFLNILSVVTIIMVLYGVLTFFTNAEMNYLKWLSSADFATVAIVLIFIAFAYKILSGGKISIPEQQKTQKTQFNIPDTYGVRGQGINLSKQHQQSQQPQQPQYQQPYVPPKTYQPKPLQRQEPKQMNIPNYFGQKKELNIPNYFGQNQQRKSGSWKCPTCGAIAIGNQCGRCGTWRQ